jgi:hypothetical protein
MSCQPNEWFVDVLLIASLARAERQTATTVQPAYLSSGGRSSSDYRECNSTDFYAVRQKSTYTAFCNSSRKILRNVFASTAADFLFIDCRKVSLINVW